jgi:hypothetical protein
MSNPNCPEHNFWIAECYQAIQSSIGTRLRNELEVPKEMPHQPHVILMQLAERPTRRRAKKAPEVQS